MITCCLCLYTHTPSPPSLPKLSKSKPASYIPQPRFRFQQQSSGRLVVQDAVPLPKPDRRACVPCDVIIDHWAMSETTLGGRAESREFESRSLYSLFCFLSACPCTYHIHLDVNAISKISGGGLVVKTLSPFPNPFDEPACHCNVTQGHSSRAIFKTEPGRADQK